MQIKLNPIETAPKDGTYILLFGDSGYNGTPLRAQVGHYDAEYRPLNPWVTHSGDAFTDGGDAPKWWLPLPVTPDPREELRAALMGEMRGCSEKRDRWPGFPGTFAFAEAALRVLDSRGLLPK